MTLIKFDSDIVGAMRKPCFAAWTAYRDEVDAEGDCADITDFRTGFVAGWDSHAAATAEAEGRLRVLAEALERIKDRVCGEAMPNWTTDIVTTGSRLYIADLCDHALQAALKEATK